MNNPITIGFYGESNSGKTSLIIKIIKYLKNMGYKIATIKNIKAIKNSVIS